MTMTSTAGMRSGNGKVIEQTQDVVHVLLPVLFWSGGIVAAPVASSVKCNDAKIRLDTASISGFRGDIVETATGTAETVKI